MHLDDAPPTKDKKRLSGRSALSMEMANQSPLLLRGVAATAAEGVVGELPLRRVPSDHIRLFQQAVDDLWERKSAPPADRAPCLAAVGPRRVPVPLDGARRRL